MKRSKFTSIETSRYSEFFRRLLQEYGESTRVEIEGKSVDSAQFSDLIGNWCTNDRIVKTRDFKLSRGKTDLYGFHDSPKELWAVETELPFVERLAADKVIRFRVLECRNS